MVMGSSRPQPISDSQPRSGGATLIASRLRREIRREFPTLGLAGGLIYGTVTDGTIGACSSAIDDLVIRA